LFGAKMDVGWMMTLAGRYVTDYRRSVARYPNIKPGEEFTGYETAK